MDPFHEELSRRVAQFAHYLDLMTTRRKSVGRDCFIIFHEEDRRKAGRAPALQRAQSRPRRLVCVTGGEPDSSDLSGSDSEVGSDCQESRGSRYVQFAFWERFFVLDLPTSTLWKPDARRIQRDRDGFFFVEERPDYPYYREDVAEHNPFQKQFVNGDAESAAQDAAYVFFQTWNFPVTSRLFATASSFFTHHKWEQSVPLD